MFINYNKSLQLMGNVYFTQILLGGGGGVGLEFDLKIHKCVYVLFIQNGLVESSLYSF